MAETDQPNAYTERDKQLNRYNRLTIYLPIGLMVAFILGLVGLMLWLVLAGESAEQSQWREFTSASADIIIILTALPFILFGALFPILAGVWIWYTWEKRYPVEKWLQGWLRRTDGFVRTNSGRLGGVAEKSANASITYRASVTRIGRIAEQSWGWLFPSTHESEKED